MITDQKIDPNSFTALHQLVTPLIPATTKTSLVFYAYKPGFSFELRDLQFGNGTLAGAVSVDAQIGGSNAILVAGAIGIDSAPEKFLLALSRYVIGDVFTIKAAATAIVFTAAHPVSLGNKFGAILVQISAAGTVSTKISGATQTTAQAYTTSGAAIAALPAATAGSIAIGYILIESKIGSAWTANTDDMTNGSDCEVATFTTYAAAPKAIDTLAAVSLKRLAGALTTRAGTRGSKDEVLYLSYTSDGSGALTNGYVTATVAARPLAGQSTFE